MNVDNLKSNCQIKAKNLKTALASVIENDFESEFLLENFVQCQTESVEAVEKLLELLMVSETEKGAN